MIDIPNHKKIILFDGICNLCNTSVLRIIKFDTKNMFVFASLQSEVGKQILQKINIDVNTTDSIILYEHNVCYDIKSTAILKITYHFGGLWKLSKLLFIIPKPIRDAVYDFIAKNRYKWFGKKNSCMLPNKELKSKFLG